MARVPLEAGGAVGRNSGAALFAHGYDRSEQSGGLHTQSFGNPVQLRLLSRHVPGDGGGREREWRRHDPLSSITADPHAASGGIALGQPKSAYGSEQPNGLLFRYSYERDDPCGVTVFHFTETWRENIEGLSAEIATFLGAPVPEVKEAIRKSKDS